MKRDDEEQLAAQITAASTRAAQDRGTGADALLRPFGCDVLIADDAGPCRELLSAILRMCARPLEIREARTGTDAVRLWFEHRPRITLLDIGMPGLDGLEALQQIRQARPDAFVAMISAGSSIDTVKQALAAGASGYVVKPYKPQRILDLLQKYRELKGIDLTT